ncbi:MAG: PmoA family protein [Planctomycetales bacterium]|nr:PmoA family protein [Planctomycetales bacterium]
MVKLCGVVGAITLLLAGYQQHRMVIRDAEGICTVADRQRILLRYNYGAMTFKPYVFELFTPAGVNVLRDQVEDHPHHHGLMLAWTVDGVDYWAEIPQSGFEVPGPFTAKARTGITTGDCLMSHSLEWMDADKKTILLHENRSIQISYDSDSDAVVAVWTSVFQFPADKAGVTLTGSHYHGLGMRFLKPMDDNGQFINFKDRPGTIFRGDERLTDAPWCAYLSSIDGRPVTIAMFDHPNNPRPATWFTMQNPFAYLSATMRLHETPMELKSGQTLTLCYGIALWDGHRSKNEIETFCRKWRNHTSHFNNP